MTYEEIKEKLDSLLKNKRLLRAKHRHIAETAELISIPAIDYSRPRVRGGSRITPQEKYVLLLEKFQDDYDKLLDKVRTDEDYLTEQLNSLPAVEQSIVIDRYMNGKKWQDIENEHGYCVRHCQRYESAAIRKITEK